MAGCTHLQIVSNEQKICNLDNHNILTLFDMEQWPKFLFTYNPHHTQTLASLVLVLLAVLNQQVHSRTQEGLQPLLYYLDTPCLSASILYLRFKADFATNIPNEIV